MVELCKRLATSPAFQNFITIVIVVAGVVVGLETDATLLAKHGAVLHTIDRLILAIFVGEIAIKVLSHGNRPWDYFRDPWNAFDFTIVAVCLLPIQGQYVTVLRLLRLLRVLRLVHALPRLQILVSALLKSIPSMAYVGMFLALLFYLYGVAGVFLFGQNDPVRFGTLGSAMISLFTVVTLEGWADLMYTQVYGCHRFGYESMEALCRMPTPQPVVAQVFFITFILFGTMIVLNLFIGVIMNSMQEAAVETERADERKRARELGTAPETMHHELFELHRAVVELGERLQRLQRRTENGANQS